MRRKSRSNANGRTSPARHFALTFFRTAWAQRCSSGARVPHGTFCPAQARFSAPLTRIADGIGYCFRLCRVLSKHYDISFRLEYSTTEISFCPSGGGPYQKKKRAAQTLQHARRQTYLRARIFLKITLTVVRSVCWMSSALAFSRL